MPDTFVEDQWVPHNPATWPWRIATLKAAVTMRDWVDHKRDPKTQEPVFVKRELPAGTKVKIVMVSRFGDVGITDNLEAGTVYGARVDLEDLEPCNG